jgi:eukaryotic-like serine/threonine-protein kinase
VQPPDPYGLVGQVLDGQFRVDRPVGEGGFSVVYRGKHLGLGEPIAIKCLKLPPRLGSAIVENFVRRFRDESKIQYKLSQASLHVARTIAAGTAMAPSVNALVPFMVLEWLEGYPLSDELRARRGRGESGRPLADVVRLLDPVAEAIAVAHGMGVVHRDLNPSNIFMALDAAGNLRPKVMDFGVAKVVSDHALALGPRTATLNQLRLFTPPYGAPEQFDDRVGPVGPWTDVYSFALVAVELLTDRTPNEGEHLLELMNRACDAANRPTPQARGAAIGAAAEQIFARALAVDPTRRPVDVGEFWGHLKHVSAGASARPGASHTAKGTFILDSPPALSAPPTTPPAFALPLVKPAQGGAQPNVPTPGSSWQSPPVLPPMNDADTWHSPPFAPSPNGTEKHPPPAGAGPSNLWNAPSGAWAAGPPTVKDPPPPTSFSPEPSISPLADSSPAHAPLSYVDPFGPTAEGNGGVEARPGASPLSITVKPGERRPDFFGPATSPKRPAGPTPHAGTSAASLGLTPGGGSSVAALGLTPSGGQQALRPSIPNPGVTGPPTHAHAPTPSAGIQPLLQYAPPGGAAAAALANAPTEMPFAPAPTPQPSNAPPYGPPPDLYRGPSGNTPYPPVRSPGGAPYANQALSYTPPAPLADRPSASRLSHAPQGRVPLLVNEGPPAPPAPLVVPPQPAPPRPRGVKPLLAWLALIVALLTAIVGLIYLIASMRQA